MSILYRFRNNTYNILLIIMYINITYIIHPVVRQYYFTNFLLGYPTIFYYNLPVNVKMLNVVALHRLLFTFIITFYRIHSHNHYFIIHKLLRYIQIYVIRFNYNLSFRFRVKCFNVYLFILFFRYLFEYLVYFIPQLIKIPSYYCRSISFSCQKNFPVFRKSYRKFK